MVDALASGASGRKAVEVRVLSWAPKFRKYQIIIDTYLLKVSHFWGSFGKVGHFCSGIGPIPLCGKALLQALESISRASMSLTFHLGQKASNAMIALSVSKSV